MSWKDGHHRVDELHGLTVLVVEDEPLIALELHSLLADEGAKVIGPGRDMAESLSLAVRDDVSAALLDVRLAGETVAPVAQALSKRGVPFAFYTGQTETDEVRARWPGAPVLAKPAPSRQVVAVIRALCASRARRTGRSALASGA